MATTKEIHELVGRAVLDRAFRMQLATNPERTAQLVGCRLTPAQVQTLKSVDIRRIGQQLDFALASFLHQKGKEYA